MANINYLIRKSHGIMRNIFAKQNSLNLKQYYFESAIILMNAILRSSVYYACETYYDLKEREIRSLESIEENWRWVSHYTIIPGSRTNSRAFSNH